jgi:hypothetical protein
MPFEISLRTDSWRSVRSGFGYGFNSARGEEVRHISLLEIEMIPADSRTRRACEGELNSFATAE